METTIEKRKAGRPVGSRDRNNIFLSDEDLMIIMGALAFTRKGHVDNLSPQFEETFTKLSSLAINKLGSAEYLRIIGQ